MVHLGDTASFLRVVRIYAKKGGGKLLPRRGKRKMKKLVHSGLVGRPGESETGGAETQFGVKCRQNFHSHLLLCPGDLVQCIPAQPFVMAPVDRVTSHNKSLKLK